MAVISTNLELLEDETTRTGFKVYTRKDIDDIRELQTLSKEQRLDMKAVSAVLPFRVNNYVIQDLIDWNNIPDDPIYQLTFPQPGMLKDEDFAHMRDLVRQNATTKEIKRRLERFRTR